MGKKIKRSSWRGYRATKFRKATRETDLYSQYLNMKHSTKQLNPYNTKRISMEGFLRNTHIRLGAVGDDIQNRIARRLLGWTGNPVPPNPHFKRDSIIRRTVQKTFNDLISLGVAIHITSATVDSVSRAIKNILIPQNTP